MINSGGSRFLSHKSSWIKWLIYDKDELYFINKERDKFTPKKHKLRNQLIIKFNFASKVLPTAVGASRVYVLVAHFSHTISSENFKVILQKKLQTWNSKKNWRLHCEWITVIWFNRKSHQNRIFIYYSVRPVLDTGSVLDTATCYKQRHKLFK